MDNGHNIVAGACFDFANHLTLLEDGIQAGKEFEAPPVIDALVDWAIGRGLNVDEPLSRSWREVIDEKGLSEQEIEKLSNWFKANMEDQPDRAGASETAVDVTLRIFHNLVTNHKEAKKRSERASPGTEEGVYARGYYDALNQLRMY